MPDLSRALEELGFHLSYPPTPDLAAAVRARITAERPAVAWWRRHGTLRMALVAAVVVAAIGISALVVPPVRDTLARFFHVRGVVIERHAVLPSPTPGAALQLGTPTTLGHARATLKFPVTLPTALGSPAAVYLGAAPPGGEVSVVYSPAPGLPQARSTGVGLLLTEFQGAVAPQLFGKILGPGTAIEEVDVAGTRGYWITGSPHAFFYQQAGAGNADEPLRLADNTLLWERDGVTLRIEGSLERDAMLRIANSVR